MRWIVLSLVLFLAGCMPGQVRTSIRDNHLRCVRFTELMDGGETTREQEQRFIHANATAWEALDEKYGR